MKFGKELASQMVPEWREAYMNYNFLKTLLKEIRNFKNRNKPPPPISNLKRRLTLHRAFSGLTQISPKYSNNHHHQDIENQPILVNSVNKENGEMYETMFLMAADEGGEYELVYFRRLDEEFNKTLKFYKSKVEEVVKEAKVLNKQMDALIAFRIKVEHPQAGFDRVVEMTRLASDVAASTAALYASTPSGARSTRGSEELSMEIIEEGEEEGSSTTRRGEEKSDESSDDKYDHHHAKLQVIQKVATVHHHVEEQKPKMSIKSKSRRPAPLDILKRITMNNTVETPRSTIKEFLNIVPNQKEMKFTRENLNKVEEQLKKAFVEFHHKLRLLKSFSFLNMLAFSKIMKKYDKVSARSASKSYMKMVDNSYLGSSDEVTKLMERVEAAFIKHFANSNRSKGMNILRPKPRRERHRITFSLGFLAGGTVALLLALILIARARDILKDSPGHDQYMRTMFPLYSLFGFVVLHLIMYAVNIFYWRRYRVNYAFIFGFKEGSELGYREVLLIGFGLSLLALASVLANLDMQMDQRTKEYQAITELLPLGLVVLVFAILFCPFNIIYRSSRYFLLTCLLHCFAAPLYKVVLPDFFLADQLTSQVQAFRSLQFYICYYGWGDYKTRQDTCRDADVFKTFLFIVAGIPYWLRLAQCLRRLYDERDMMQGYNGLKYFLTIIAVSTRTAYSLTDSDSWKFTAWIASLIAVIIATYWDIIHDWGLLQKNSKNRWLRDKLLVPHKSVYFLAMLLNVLLRLAWIQTVVKFEVDFLHKETQVTIWACLEIIRRGIWNFFRLENEHLNNVGKYRAFKSVPLPFNYDEDEKDD